MESEPLASSMRPNDLRDFFGQEHLVGAGKPLKLAIDKKELFSFILWGPPGCGKTTLARLYARALNADFFEISAVDSSKDDVRRIIGNDVVQSLAFGRPKIVFIDEIHRFNKAQQDYLLPFVERGDITLIGATTENPSFVIISPLLSRSRVFILQALSEREMRLLLKRTKIDMSRDARDWLIRMSGGDARQALTTLSTAHRLYGEITLENLKQVTQHTNAKYDKKGDEHFNTISAYIKSMRASQVDAALYYLARMVDSGEDPLFIARRMVVFASEDVGLAVPTALVVANAVFRACETVGYPECAINLAHGTVYLSTCKKSRVSYDAYLEALADVKAHGSLPIPLKIRNAPTKLMKDFDYHKGYQLYDKESYLPDKIKKRKYFK